MSLTRKAIDEEAAKAASVLTAELQAEPPMPNLLAYGARGEAVARLVDLLAYLGHESNSVIKGGPAILDETVIADVRAAQDALSVDEPESSNGVEGELIGEPTWTALYAAAEAKLEAQKPREASETGAAESETGAAEGP
jgi:hypothetical protein